MTVTPVTDIGPDSDFTLDIVSTVNSSVSLLAIDQRVLLTSSNHDITKDFVFDHELIKYDRIPLENQHDPEVSLFFYPRSYQKRFIDVGAVILTNAKQEIPCEPSPATPSSEATEVTYSTSEPISVPPVIECIEDEAKNYFESFLFETIYDLEPFNEFNVRADSSVNYTSPDFPNSWMISAVTLSNAFGLGLSGAPVTLNTYLPFYIELIDPVYMRVGEIAQLEILVVNQFDEDLIAVVDFYNENHAFKFIRPSSYNWTQTAEGQNHTFLSQKQSIHRLRIEIQPEVIGIIALHVSVSSQKAGDAVEHHLTVFPPGFRNFENHAEFVFVDECDEGGKNFSLKLTIPEDAIESSIKVDATVSGDVLAFVLVNLDFLIRVPTGCGEQTMIDFVPNVLVLEYLIATKHLTEEIWIRATNNLQIGYQRMLSFRHSDGSFSAFGNSDHSGSTWLTAYVVKFLLRSRTFVEIEDLVVEEALDFIIGKQEPNGTFREDGVVIHTEMQSGTEAGIAFTAFISIVIQESLETHPQFQPNVDNAISYLLCNYDLNDVYSLSIFTYLLHLIEHDDQVKLYQEFAAKANSTATIMYWKNEPSTESINSLDIEITAYGLLTLFYIPDLTEEAFKVFQWLISQQNSNGGFQSTQDTVVALMAITQFATKLSTLNTIVVVDLKPDHGTALGTKVNNTNSLVPQKYHLQNDVRQLDVTVTGTGFAIVQLSCGYNVERPKPKPKFKLWVRFGKESCINKLILYIHASLMPDVAKNISDMVVFKIDFPSGFEFDHDTPLSPEIQVSKSSNIKAKSEYFIHRNWRNIWMDQQSTFT